MPRRQLIELGRNEQLGAARCLLLLLLWLGPCLAAPARLGGHCRRKRFLVPRRQQVNEIAEPAHHLVDCWTGETPVAAALRELAEELGLIASPEAVLGLLDDYPTRSGYLITPVILWAANGRTLRPNPDEVASVHRIGLDTILADDAFDFTVIPESTRRVVRFHAREGLIHAPTAALIYQFREVCLSGNETRVAHYEQPEFAWA